MAEQRKTDPRPADARPGAAGGPGTTQTETERPVIHEERRASPAFDPTGQEMRVPPRPARSTGWQRPALVLLAIVVVLLVLLMLF